MGTRRNRPPVDTIGHRLIDADKRSYSLASYYRKHEENKARQRAYYAANAARLRAAAKRRREDDPAKARGIRKRHWANGGREKQAEWNAAHPDRIAEYQRCYMERNLPKFADKNQRRRAKVRASEVEKIDRLAIYDRDGGLCHICGKRVSARSFTLDHLVPIARGGPHIATNVRVAHKSCNSRRGADRLPAQLILV